MRTVKEPVSVSTANTQAFRWQRDRFTTYMDPWDPLSSSGEVCLPKKIEMHHSVICANSGTQEIPSKDKPEEERDWNEYFVSKCLFSWRETLLPNIIS